MDSPRLLAKVIELSSCLDCRGQDEADRRVWWLFLEIWGNYLVWLKRWACNRMIDNDKLIIFACQVLEYQPEPSNQWTTVGQLETGRNYHAVLSIDSEALPCLQACLKRIDYSYGFRSLSCLSSIIHDIFSAGSETTTTPTTSANHDLSGEETSSIGLFW